MNKKIKTAIIIIPILVLILVVFLVVNARSKDSPENDTMNTTPATETEIQEAQSNKEKIIEDSATQTKPDSSLNEGSTTQQTKVTPVISGYGQNLANNNLEANGFVSNVIEDGGICTLRANGPTNVEVTSNAFADAKTTNCGQLVIPANKLKSGKYKISITYSSAKHQGASDIISVEVVL